MDKTFKYRNGYFFVAQKVYSDFGAHLPLIRSFSFGANFKPIENPQFPNQPIKYHYLFFLAVAFLEKIGFNLAFALNFLSALGLALLLFMIYKITFLFWHQHLIAILSVVLFIFNGSLSFVYFFLNNRFTAITDLLSKIIHNKNFNSFGPWNKQLVSAFWNLNIYTNQRHLGFSFGLTLLLIYYFLKIIINNDQKKTQKRKIKTKAFFFTKFFRSLFHKQLMPNQIVLGILSFLLLILPIFNIASYILSLIFICFLLLFNFKIFWQKNFFLLDTIIVINIIISFLIFLNLPQGNFQPFLKLGFLSPNSQLNPQENQIKTILVYWLFNLGFYLFFWFFNFFYFRKNTLIIQFLAINSLFFILANVIQLSPDMINNHKLVNFFLIGLNITTAKVIFDFLTYKNSKQKILSLKQHWHFYLEKMINLWFYLITKILVVLILFFLIFSGILDIFPIFNDETFQIADYQNSPIANYIKNQTPKNSIFLTTTYLYNPASLVGRKIFIDYGYFAWSYGYNTSQRTNLLKQIFTTTNKYQLCNLLYFNNLNYFLISPNFEDSNLNIKNSLLINIPAEFISADNYQLINLNNYCQN